MITGDAKKIIKTLKKTRKSPGFDEIRNKLLIQENTYNTIIGDTKWMIQT